MANLAKQTFTNETNKQTNKKRTKIKNKMLTFFAFYTNKMPEMIDLCVRV